MKYESIDFLQSGILNPLIKAYLTGDESLESLVNIQPSIEGMETAIKQRAENHPVDRERLVDVLRSQYNELDPTFFTKKQNAAVTKNVDLLLSQNCYTITTGHQLNIFGGFQYFIYKIVNAIKYCEALSERYPDKHFVPVYWMATEDHDFDEISRLYYEGNNYHWNQTERGAVGRMAPTDILKIITELSLSDEQEKLFTKAYGEHPTLSLATRYWVNQLFSDYGLVILDADNPSLKSALQKVAEQDILNGLSQEASSASKDALERAGFKSQALVRECNFFLLRDGYRERIEKSREGEFITADSSHSFSPQELQALINEHPEQLSPNVILRPVYQELLLPNLAYIGGGGEISYWLQLKSIFDEYKVFFPQLVVRNSAAFISTRSWNKGTKGLPEASLLFQRESEMLRDTTEQATEASELFSMLHSLEELSNKSQVLANEEREALAHLAGPVLAKHIAELKDLRQKLRKQIRSDGERRVQAFRDLHSELFPKGKPQERVYSFLPQHKQYSKRYFDLLMRHFSPIPTRFHIFLY